MVPSGAVQAPLTGAEGLSSPADGGALTNRGLDPHNQLKASKLEP